MIKSPRMDIDLKIWVLIQQISDAMFFAREKEIRRYGISMAESQVLSIIQFAGNSPTPSEISRLSVLGRSDKSMYSESVSG